MIRSMTGFASARGGQGPHGWVWEMRSVNARGLDIRLRVPDWLEGLEAALRAELSKSVTRGNITLNLRLTRETEAGQLRLSEANLSSALEALERIEAQALDRGLTLAPSRATDILSLRGVFETAPVEDDAAPLVAVLRAEFAGLVAGFIDMREKEGTALAQVLDGQLDRVAELTEQAATLARARKDAMADALRQNLQKVLNNADGADPDRVAQELALIAVKSDVTEEIDRLGAHIAAARDLLAGGGPVGRKLDFLMQEFNREANTLCSKSQSADLTAVGLEMKVVIDQMREQVQNVE